MKHPLVAATSRHIEEAARASGRQDETVTEDGLCDSDKVKDTSAKPVEVDLEEDNSSEWDTSMFDKTKDPDVLGCGSGAEAPIGGQGPG